ncbi:fructosamine kinase family protein [Puerhibacterium puerhi]|uniref:fructosamine kinase family protein n=1 Tax=Puerhibacterium puerhi TaxID=2692623 RepID=UPI001F283948|nr:fructosamine kinase family protein [Puerhibacterium puerhi]
MSERPAPGAREALGAAPADVFRKARRGAPAGFFACEAAGLAWLAEPPGGPRVARVLGVGDDHLDLERVAPAPATAAAARAFGGALAALHDAGAPAFGALPPGYTARFPGAAGFFGPLGDPLPMPGGAWPTWAEFYAEARLRPVLAQGRARGVLDGDDERLVERVCARLPRLAGAAADDPPVRLHGDLWSGNVLWSADGAVLVDPAAHGGHREADLAMLALFGAPHLAEILAGYAAAHPLARGWRHRVRLHQLYPLAVHAVLFGGGYVAETRALLRDLAG